MNAWIEMVDRGRWHELAPSFRDYNYRQLWAYGARCAARVGAAREPVVIMDGTQVCGLADVRIKRIPLLSAGIAYVAGGPLVRRDDHGDGDRLRTCLQALTSEYVERRGLVLRILAPLGAPEWNRVQEDLFASAGFVPTTQAPPYRTIVVDLAPSEDDIRKGFSQRWRRSLNQAQRENLRVCTGTDRPPFSRFCGLYDGLLTRKRFSVELDARFYADLQEALDQDEKLELLLACADDQPVSGLVLSVLGDTCVFLLAASSDIGLERRASFLVQWHALQEARRRGCRWYDLGGIDPVGNAGVYEFKKGMGGADLTAPGPFERRPRGIGGRVATYAERTYRWLRGVRVGRVPATDAQARGDGRGGGT